MPSSGEDTDCQGTPSAAQSPPDPTSEDTDGLDGGGGGGDSCRPGCGASRPRPAPARGCLTHNDYGPRRGADTQTQAGGAQPTCLASSPTVPDSGRKCLVSLCLTRPPSLAHFRLRSPLDTDSAPERSLGSGEGPGESPTQTVLWTPRFSLSPTRRTSATGPGVPCVRGEGRGRGRSAGGPPGLCFSSRSHDTPCRSGGLSRGFRGGKEHRALSPRGRHVLDLPDSRSRSPEGWGERPKEGDTSV